MLSHLDKTDFIVLLRDGLLCQAAAKIDRSLSGVNPVCSLRAAIITSPYIKLINALGKTNQIYLTLQAADKIKCI